MNKSEPVPARERVAKRRAALRARGLKPKQFWVLDLDNPEVRRKVREACERISNSPKREDEIALSEAIQYLPPDEPD